MTYVPLISVEDADVAGVLLDELDCPPPPHAAPATAAKAASNTTSAKRRAATMGERLPSNPALNIADKPNSDTAVGDRGRVRQSERRERSPMTTRVGAQPERLSCKHARPPHLHGSRRHHARRSARRRGDAAVSDGRLGQPEQHLRRGARSPQGARRRTPHRGRDPRRQAERDRLHQRRHRGGQPRTARRHGGRARTRRPHHHERDRTSRRAARVRGTREGRLPHHIPARRS